MRIVGHKKDSEHPIGGELWLDESYASYCEGMYGKQALTRLQYGELYKRINNVKTDKK